LKLSDLVKGLHVENPKQTLDPTILGITHDSRKVNKGFLFVSLKGQSFNGNQFIAQAIEKGCVGVISEDEVSVPPEIVLLVIKNLRSIMAQLAKRFYSCPDQSLKLIGVTGTNGKTTTTTLVQQLLTLSGYSCGLIGTVENIVGGVSMDSIRTTPESTDFFSFLRQSCDTGDHYVSTEVSSIGLEMSRVEGAQFAVGAFTNLTHDHLDFHKDMESYFNSKAKLMQQSNKFIINVDDPYVQRLKTSRSALTLGMDSNADYHISGLCLSPTDTEFHFRTPKGSYFFRSPLLGRFNVYNLAFALAIYSELGLEIGRLQPVLDRLVGAKGRFERIKTPSNQTFGVLVDYAHTPDALEKICTEGKKLILSGSRLHVLFGCGGNRDKTKRSEMARIVSNHADVIWHTSDNPRDEDIESILDDAAAGLSSVIINNASSYHRIPDRSQAVEFAINDLRHGDLLILAGKGHENYQEIKGVKYPYNDKDCAEYHLGKRS
jgi:UDP-N-acetylmuramoyl-L-alanyl-D-glutamate--2,6-diaminopimelate ligase